MLIPNSLYSYPLTQAQPTQNGKHQDLDRRQSTDVITQHVDSRLQLWAEILWYQDTIDWPGHYQLPASEIGKLKNKTC